MTIAKQKRSVSQLDELGAHGYDCVFMRWISTFAALWLLLAGCQSNQNVQVLSPEKFAAATSGAAYSTTDTNATAGTNAKPRVVIPGITISIAVDEDHSLNRAYLVPVSGTIDYP